MTYDFQKQFFLVTDDDTGDTKLFRLWWHVVDFLTDDIMKHEYHIINDGEDANFTWMSNWRAPKDRKECFDLLFNMETTGDLNNLLEDLWHTELIEFSD